MEPHDTTGHTLRKLAMAKICHAYSRIQILYMLFFWSRIFYLGGWRGCSGHLLLFQRSRVQTLCTRWMAHNHLWFKLQDTWYPLVAFWATLPHMVHPEAATWIKGKNKQDNNTLCHVSSFSRKVLRLRLSVLGEDPSPITHDLTLHSPKSNVMPSSYREDTGLCFFATSSGLERTTKHTDGSKDSLRLSELRSGMCVIASLACPLQGPWDLAFMIGPLEATLEPSSWVP